MNYGILLLLFLIIYLYFISRKITQGIYSLIMLLTGNSNFAINSVAVIFLTGTAIHELSHFITATILRIPTGNISIIPKIEAGGEVKTGKVEIAKVDPFRYSIIGYRPYCYLFNRNINP
jgi:hypothetical protein